MTSQVNRSGKSPSYKELMKAQRIALVKRNGSRVVVIDCSKGDKPEVTFSTALRTAAMKRSGLQIPDAFAKYWGGRKAIRVDDPDFKDAYLQLWEWAHKDCRNLEWKILK